MVITSTQMEKMDAPSSKRFILQTIKFLRTHCVTETENDADEDLHHMIDQMILFGEKYGIEDRVLLQRLCALEVIFGLREKNNDDDIKELLEKEGIGEETRVRMLDLRLTYHHDKKV